VPGAGPEDAELLLIGEAPGYYEDQKGLPFVGPAGRFLEQLLASIGLDRSQVYITNVVKCRPPGNRDPLPNEISSCGKFLTRQLDLIKPKIVITLGRYSLARFLPNEAISRVHGKPRQVDGITVFPMYHPAAALHQQRYRQTIIDDMKAVPDLLKDAPQEQEPPPSQDEQLSMF
jgi:DNA polymerase